MKWLKRFESHSRIDSDILNIARDEGLHVEVKDGAGFKKISIINNQTSYSNWLDRSKHVRYGNISGSTLLSNDKFFQICESIVERLKYQGYRIAGSINTADERNWHRSYYFHWYKKSGRLFLGKKGRKVDIRGNMLLAYIYINEDNI